MILFFSQPAKLVFQVSIAGFRVKLTKFPYAGTQVFSLDFGDSTGYGLKKGIMNKNVLRLKEMSIAKKKVNFLSIVEFWLRFVLQW